MPQRLAAVRPFTFVAGLLAASLLTALPSSAPAQTTSATPAAPASSSSTVTPAHAHRGGARGLEARIGELHKSLQINADQEALWTSVAATMRDNAATLSTLAKQRHDNAATMTALDDLHSFEALTQAHADAAKKLTAAFEPLYAAMSDAQKKNADAVFAHRIARRHHHGKS